MSSDKPVIDYARPPQQRASSIVTMSVLGIIVFGVGAFLILLPDLHNDRPFFLIWLIAAVFGTPPVLLALWRTSGRDRAGRTVAVVSFAGWLCCALLSTISIYHWFAHLDPHITTRNRWYCHQHLFQLGQAIMMYRSANAGQFPASLASLAATPNLEWEMVNFTCPGVHPNGYYAKPTTQEVITLYQSPATAPYVYRAANLKPPIAPKAIVAHDQLDNHTHDGSSEWVYFLYADESVEYLERRAAIKVIAELDAGHNPPRPEKLK